MISLNWLKDYVDIENENPKELAVKITKAGVNIEEVIDKHIEKIVIGKVLECKNHPDSDHLHVCKVDIGSEVLQIVCGAPNVRKDLKVIVAMEGAILPGNFEIKKSTIRGIESNGMLCALFELGVEEKTEENYNKGIHEVEDDIKVGTDANIYLGLDDVLYELDVHKHRNNDCYYHIGFAYEVACILNKKVNIPKISYKEIETKTTDLIDLEVKTDKCKYYVGKYVKDVKIKESPDFIKKRLQSVGMRLINNVVDISNYVMLEFGQPLHFFDAKKLGNKVVVDTIKNEEEFTTLDGNNRVLKENDIVIKNNDKTVCIAGVMGGENTEVDENTKEIFIESAIFDSVQIRNTAERLNLRSEASIRYGKGLSYEYTNMAINRACELLEKYADAKICKDTVSHDEVDKTLKTVEFTTDDINKILGIKITDEDVEKELSRLDFAYTKNEKFLVTIPSRRLDIDSNVNDIAEEIGRLYGYHNLVSTLPIKTLKLGEYKGDVDIRKKISKRLRSLGLNEVKTYTLISPDMAKLFRYDNKENLFLPNPMSIDKSVIRTSLLPSLLSAYNYNKTHNVKDILMYEIGKTYDVNYKEESKVAILMKGNYIVSSWQNKGLNVDFYLIKGIIENLLDYLGFKNRYHFVKELIPDTHPGISSSIYIDKERVGIIGKINPSLNKDDIYIAEVNMTMLDNLKIKPLKYKEPSKYPEIIKDVAFIVDNKLDSETIKKVIIKNGGRILNEVEVFDLYQNIAPNKKSIAYKLVFKDENRTLKQDEVMEIFNKIIENVCKEFNCELRSNS